MDDKENQKEFQTLSRKIMEAITQNAEVMALIQDLKKRGIVDQSTLLGLALRIGEIVEISGMAFRQDELEEQVEKIEPAQIPEQLSAGTELVDGRELSKKEAAFQAWSAERFDERAWLKKMGLIF